MIYVKSAVAGVVAALLAAVLWILASFVLPIVLILLRQYTSAGSGGVGAVSIGSGSITLAALAGFAVGFFWMLRRARRSTP
jgi:hypothetical protein